MIERAPHVELLTTSRERLNVQSEWVFDVEGLGLAENGERERLGAAALRRAGERRSRPGFALDEDGTCRRSASAGSSTACRSASSSPPRGCPCSPAPRSRTRSRATSTSSPRRCATCPERHRSLRAAIDQSWRLLTDEQRDAFCAAVRVPRRASIASAAVAVTGADLRLLSELVAKSLLRRPDFGRFELHELLRQYAAEQLGGVTRRAGGRPRAACASLRGDAPGAAGGTAGPGVRGRAGRAARRAGQPSRGGRVDPRRGRRATRRWTCSKPSTRSSGCTAGSKAAETLERLARTAGFDADDPGSASAVALAAAMYRVAHRRAARVRPGRGGARPPLRARPAGAEPGAGARTLPVRARHRGGVPGRLPGGGGVPRRGQRRSRERPATGSPRAGL